MRSRLKKFLKKLLDLEGPSLLSPPIFNFSDDPRYYIKSFGKGNPDNVFYVICRSPGSGFFSNFSYVLNHLKIADLLGFTPVVDMENFTNFYNEKDQDLLPFPIRGKTNSWEYYFHPVSGYSLKDVYQSKTVILTDGAWPRNMTMNITSDPDLYDIFSKYIKINDYILQLVDEFTHRNFTGQKVLGVHFRGSDQRTATLHSFPPTPKQILSKVKLMIETKGFSRIFLVTEEQSYLDLFKREFSSMLCYTESYRTYYNNNDPYKIYPRKNHRFFLGRDILVDTLLLSKSNSLICGDSNVAEVARFIGRVEQSNLYIFYNGVNSANPIVAKYLWFIKKSMPERFGGFPDE